MKDDEEVFRQLRTMMIYEAVERTVKDIPLLQQERAMLRRHVLHLRRQSRDAELKGTTSRPDSKKSSSKKKKNGDGLMLTHIRPASSSAPTAVQRGVRFPLGHGATIGRTSRAMTRAPSTMRLPILPTTRTPIPRQRSK